MKGTHAWTVTHDQLAAIVAPSAHGIAFIIIFVDFIEIRVFFFAAWKDERSLGHNSNDWDFEFIFAGKKRRWRERTRLTFHQFIGKLTAQRWTWRRFFLFQNLNQSRDRVLNPTFYLFGIHNANTFLIIGVFRRVCIVHRALSFLANLSEQRISLI